MYINAEALHGGLIWECYFHFLYRNYILFHQAALSLQLLLLTLQYMLRFVRNSAINGQGVAFWVFLYVIILYIQTHLWWHTSPLWGTWEAFLPWTSLFILWDGETEALTMFAQLSYWATAWITLPLCCLIPQWVLKLLIHTPREYFCLFQFWHWYKICYIIFP